VKIKFHARARVQLNEIWDYSADQWGEEQADRYIAGIHSQILQALTNSSKGLKLPFSVQTKLDLRVTRYKRHYVFAVIEKNSLRVISILHDSMDLPQRLREALS